jgi:lipoate-protein ligase B
MGIVDYAVAWNLQKELVESKAAGNEERDFLILLEHPHVITVGRKGNMDNVLDPRVPVYRVERGGDATYHGPGQLVAYPIVSLVRTNFALRDFVRALERIIIETLSTFSITSSAIEGKTGVWVGNKKIASIGLAVDRWITYHGLALNVNTDLAYFGMIRPCGFSAETMTSVEKITGKSLDMRRVKDSLVRAYARVMGARMEAESEWRDYSIEPESLVD